MSGPPLKASARRVGEALAALGFDFQIELYPEGTRSAVEAVQASRGSRPWAQKYA